LIDQLPVEGLKQLAQMIWRSLHVYLTLRCMVSWILYHKQALLQLPVRVTHTTHTISKNNQSIVLPHKFSFVPQWDWTQNPRPRNSCELSKKKKNAYWHTLRFQFSFSICFAVGYRCWFCYNMYQCWLDSCYC
jgi:hypothetical protein